MLKVWKRRHAVSDKAFEELIQTLCHVYGVPEEERGAFVRSLSNKKIPKDVGDKYKQLPESEIQKRVRLEFQNKYRAPLWRNNVGGDKFGNRWGLCNETKAQNKVIKSSDLIGITPTPVQDLVASGRQTVGVFTALEVKKGSWRYRATPEEKAQLRFLNLVEHLGGYSKFISNPEDV
jgi:hypothetical protein